MFLDARRYCGQIDCIIRHKYFNYHRPFGHPRLCYRVFLFVQMFGIFGQITTEYLTRNIWKYFSNKKTLLCGRFLDENPLLEVVD